MDMMVASDLHEQPPPQRYSNRLTLSRTTSPLPKDACQSAHLALSPVNTCHYHKSSVTLNTLPRHRRCVDVWKQLVMGDTIHATLLSRRSLLAWLNRVRGTE